MKKTLFIGLFLVALALTSKAQAISNDTLTINSDSSTVRLVFFENKVQVTALHLDGRMRGFVDYDPQAWFNKIWRVTTEEGRRDLQKLAKHRGLRVPRDPEASVSL